MSGRRPFLLAAPALLAGAAVRAQTFPDRPLRLVVPFPPGGPTDLVARPMAQRLGEAFGQPVVVDNRGGAGGNVAAEQVARAAPDGHTLLFSNVGVLAINAALYGSLPYDPERDLASIALVAGAPVALVVAGAVPVTDLAGFVAWTRVQREPVAYGTASAGSPGHLAGEMFRHITGARIQHLPYRGSAPALQDLAAGHIQAMFDPLQSPLAQVQAGRVRALAVSAAARSPALPEVPTMIEAGVPGHEMVAWWGIVAPAATPAAVQEQLTRETMRIATSPAWAEYLGRLGVSALARGGADFTAFRAAETARWGEAVRRSGATAS